MSVTPARSYSRVAIAIIIAAVVVSASVLSYSSFETTVTRTGTSETTTATTTLTVVDISTIATTVTRTQTTTCIEGVLASSTSEAPGTSNLAATVIPSNSANDCQLGVSLGVAADPTITMGQNETIYVSLSNDFATPNDVNYTGLPTLLHGFDFYPGTGTSGDYILPIPDTCISSSSAYEPAFIAVYNASGVPVQLSEYPLYDLDCPNESNYHSFNASQTITESLSVGGSWTSSNTSMPWLNATYSQFNPGNYTIVAFDLWGQTAELNFTVLPVSLDYLSASCYSGSDDANGPCWGNAGAYVFDCAGAAATSQGCTQEVTGTLPPYWSYTINIRYFFTNRTTQEINQSEPSSVNCLWTVQGITPGQGYAFCIPVGSNSFVMGEPAGPPE